MSNFSGSHHIWMLIFLIGIGIIGIGTPRSFFLYKAIECHADFVIHCEGIALDAEVTVGLQGAEVQAQRAVVASQRLAYHLTLSLSRRWRKKALVAAKKVATPAALMMTTVQKEAS